MEVTGPHTAPPITTPEPSLRKCWGTAIGFRQGTIPDTLPGPQTQHGMHETTPCLRPRVRVRLCTWVLVVVLTGWKTGVQ